MLLKHQINRIINDWIFCGKVSEFSVLYLIVLDIVQDHPILKVVNPIKCQSEQHFDEFFQQCTKDGKSEGIVLRDPKAWYYESNSFFTKKVRLVRLVGDGTGDHVAI